MDGMIALEREDEICPYKNPELMNYKCEGQISLFDVFEGTNDFQYEERKNGKQLNSIVCK